MAAKCHGSQDLQRQWEECCAKAMGISVTNEGEKTSDKRTSSFSLVILNLLDNDDMAFDDDDDGIDSDHDDPVPTIDPWLENAHRIDQSLTQMSDMILKNRLAYVSPNHFDGQHDNVNSDEQSSSLLESTVLSFAATCANQIESLRHSPRWESTNEDHCAGIVACLLLRLRKDVAEPMSCLQKQRARKAMTIWHQPLACTLAPKKDSFMSRREEDAPWDALVDNDNEDGPSQDQRFLPTRESTHRQSHFMEAYQHHDISTADLQRPQSMFQKQKLAPHEPPTDSATTESNKPKKAKGWFSSKQQPQPKMQQQQQLDYDFAAPSESSFSPQEELQREAALLTASLQNDLDSVHTIETRMTEITALLSQFSALVSEQQEEIVAIHHSTVSSKDNIEKGQTMLIDATERTKQSKHYMATVIWSMALLLLFFNHITP